MSETTKILSLVVLAFLMLCVRPVHADGVVVPTYNQWRVGTYGIASDPVTACKNIYAGNQGNMDRASGYFLTETRWNCTIAPTSTGIQADNGQFAIPYPSGTGGTCPANSAGTAPACACSAGFVPSADGVIQSSPNVSPGPKYCIASTNAAVAVVHKYGLPSGITVCSADGVCTGDPTYSSPAAACASQNVSYSNQSTSCTLVQGTSCVCSTTYSDGSPPNIQVQAIADLVPCPAGDLICTAAKDAVNGTSERVAAAAAAAAAASAAAGGTSAAQTAAASAAATAAANPVTAGATVATAQATGQAVAAAIGGGSSAPVTIDLPPDLAKTGDITTQTASINAKLDELKFPFDDVASKLGAAPGAETIPSETPVFTASTVAFTNSVGCPAPVTFDINMPYFVHSYSIGFQSFCDLASTIRPMVLAFAAITAAMIFMAGVFI